MPRTMKTRRFIGFFLGVTLAFVLSPVAVSTSVPTAHANQDAASFIDTMATRAIEALTDPELGNAVRAERFRELLKEGMDIPDIARRVLGPYVRRATDEELVEFEGLLEENIVRRYAIMFKDYSGERIEVVEVRNGRRGSEIVTVEIHLTDGSPPVEVQWVVHKVGSMYKVIDIIVENASMVTTQKEEFVSVIRRGGGEIESLLIELRERNEEMAENILN